MPDSSIKPRLPLSPASPPDSGLKSHSENHAASAVNPMSVATKSYVPFSHDGRHTNEMASRSPDQFKNQSQKSSVAPNPTQYSNNLKRALSQDDESHPNSKRQRTESATNGVQTEPSLIPTNHDRSNVQSPPKDESRMEVTFDEKPEIKEIPQVDRPELDTTFEDFGPALLIRKTSKANPILALSDLISPFLYRSFINAFLQLVNVPV